MSLPFQPTAPQPFPQFYIYRPYSIVPLVALDELPSWVQVGNWDWTNPALFQGMNAASTEYIERRGEYDVICHHCAETLDNLHKSVSQRSDNSKCSADSPEAAVTNGDKSWPGAPFPAMQDCRRESAVGSSLLPYAALQQPPFQATLSAPLVGMCLVQFPILPTYAGPPPPSEPPGMIDKPCASPDGSDTSHRSSLNPEAPVFSPREDASLPTPPVTPPSIDDDASSLVSRQSWATSRTSQDPERTDTVDVGGSPVSPIRKSAEIPLDELKRALDIKDLRRVSALDSMAYIPMTKTPRDMRKRPFREIKRKKRHPRRAINSSGSGDGRPEVPVKKLGRFNVVFPHRNSAVERRSRREKMAAEKKRDPAERFWHMSSKSSVGSV